MAFLDFLFGSKEKIKNIPIFSKQQNQFLDQTILPQLQKLFAQSQSNPLQPLQQFQQQFGQQFGGQGLLNQSLEQLSSPNTFENTKKAEINRFYNETIPGLAERFQALQGGGTRLGSGGFTGALGAAGAGLSQNLSALQEQFDQANRDRQAQLVKTLFGAQLGQQELGQRNAGQLTQFGLGLGGQQQDILTNLLSAYLQPRSNPYGISATPGLAGHVGAALPYIAPGIGSYLAQNFIKKSL